LKPILEFFHDFWETQLHYTSEQNLSELKWDDFIRIVSLLNIKSCGTNIEKRILEQNSWTKIRGQASHGDGKKHDGTVVEIKSSIISPLPSSGITFRGIRPWHDVSEYYFILIDLSQYKCNPKTTVFKLTKDQVIQERDIHEVLKPYNMKKADRINNQSVELGTSFKKGDLERWKEAYDVTMQIKL
jgi:hypothetical protein